MGDFGLTALNIGNSGKYASKVPKNIGSQNAATAVCKAAYTWDLKTSNNLFNGDDHNNDTTTGQAAVALTSYTPRYSNRPSSDGKNVEAWTTGFGRNSNIIALTITWYSNSKIQSNDGVPRFKALESDCWYNSYFNWRIASDGDTSTSKNTFDLQTISLHELGHTLGLDDLYSASNSNKVMYGYNDGSVKRTLTANDTAGLQKLYGI